MADRSNGTAALAELLVRATEPPPPDLAGRVAQAAARALPSVAGEAAPISAGHAEDGPTEPSLEEELQLGELSLSPAGGRRRSRGRWWLAVAAAMVVVFAGAAAVLTGGGGDDGTLGTLPDRGRLPARVPVGDAPWVLTWLPDGYGPVRGGGSSVVVEAPGRPSLEIRAREGEEAVSPPLVALGPMADAHVDPDGAMIRWSRQGWTLEVEATEPVPEELLRLMATTTVHADALVGPDPGGGTATVPDVVGDGYQEATEVLEAAGFHVTWGIEASRNPPEPPGTVVRQEPGASAEAEAGSSVVLVVSGEITGMPTPGTFMLSGGGPDETSAGYAADWVIFGIGWSRPEPDPLYLNVDPLEELDVELVVDQPVVFFHGELVGYGVGEGFEPLWRAAAATEPPPSTAPVTTTMGGAGGAMPPTTPG